MRNDPVAAILGLTGCVFDWILTRPWKMVSLFFLPLVLAALVAGLVLAGLWRNPDMLADQYLRLANEEVASWESNWAPANPAGEAGDDSRLLTPEPTGQAKITPAAEMLFRRVQQLQKNDRRSIFFVAMSYVQRGALQQGMAMLTRIAPHDAIGYLPAHAYLCEYYFSRPIASEDLPVLRHHMLAALRWERASPPLLGMISQVLYSMREMDASVEAMSLAAKRDPAFNLPMAKLCAPHAKYRLRFDEAIESAEKHFVHKLERNPQDSDARLLLADTYCQSSDFVSAERTLIEGMKLSADQVYRTALSEVYCRTFSATSRFSNNSWSGDIALLEKAYRLDPNNLNIYEEVAKLARIDGASPHEGLMDQLRRNLAEGKATSVTHNWIAEHYLVHKQYDRAIPHLEQAVKRDPNASRCWNNLAYCIADLYPDRLEEALKHADQAVNLARQVPDYYDTRGTVLMKMKRYTDAVASFEQAIEAVANSGGRFLAQPGYHRRLAEAYKALDNPSMAQVHEELAVKVQQDRDAQSQASEQPAEASPSAPSPAADSQSPAPQPQAAAATPDLDSAPTTEPGPEKAPSEAPSEAPSQP